MRASALISVSFLWAMQPMPALAQPSFDCSRASTPDLVAICQSPALSALDRVANQGYMYLRSSLGPSTANSINRPLIAARQRCGLDQTCIEAQQIDAIKTFRAYGAPINAATAVMPTKSQNGDRTTQVSMEVTGGTYSVPVYINEKLKINFIVDSGASDVSMPSDVVTTLIKTGTIDKTDLLGSNPYRLADGSVVNQVAFNIRSLRVADKILHNVKGSVANDNSPLLLGQSFLARFSSWSINNNSHTLILND